MMTPHIPVLLREVLDAFQPLSLQTFIDCTLGGGGHSNAILEAHPEIQCLVGIDQDPDAREESKKLLKKWGDKVVIVEGNFKDLTLHLRKLGISSADGILMDLGVSSMQLDRPEKGFSFMRPGPLDMRMDQENPLTAQEIVNTWPEKEIARIVRDFGEETQWKGVARAIVAARPFYTTKELADALYPVLARRSKEGIHPLTLTFQALRIAVNGELEVLKAVLPQAVDRLNSGGRLAVISFHSLEDRIVKHRFQFEASDKMDTSGLAGLFLPKEQRVEILTRKPVISSDEESAENPRSRSAKLRVVEKK